jgi:Zn-dependent protease with chaperone function
MPFLLLALLALACLPDPGTGWPEAPWGPRPWLSAALTGLTVFATAGTAYLVALRARRLRPGETRRFERARRRHQWLLLGLFAVALLVFGWGRTVGVFWRVGDRLLPGAEVLVLAPFLVSLLLSWACYYDVDRVDGIGEKPMTSTECVDGAISLPADTADAGLSRWGYVLFHTRQKLALAFIPLGMLLGLKELSRLLPDDASSAPNPWTLVGLVGVLAAFVAMPWAVRLALGLRPLPDSPLKRRLTDTARRLGFRSSGLMLWDTRHGMANAMVVGLLPWPRYVIFTDRLLSEFTPDETEAVLGHEIGHVKHRHMFFYLAFLTGSLMVLWLTFTFLPESQTTTVETRTSVSMGGTYFSLGNHPWLQVIPPVAALGLYIVLVFGFVSRRCERQADVFGCKAVSCGRPDCDGHHEMAPTARARRVCPAGIATFVAALEKVAWLNGIPLDRPGWLQSWQHSTIARRIAFLRGLNRDPGLEPAFQRRTFLLKGALLAILGLALALLLKPDAEGQLVTALLEAITYRGV